jgi:SPP1 gp7 family putative phage head morphogenesis protein
LSAKIKVNTRFAFSTSANKVTSFMSWLEDKNDNGILGITAVGDRRQYSGRRAWEQLYIDSAYKKGMVFSDKQLAKKGLRHSSLPPKAVYPVDSFFNAPIHADRVGLIYTRTYSSLKGVTDAMDARISSTLAQGIADGKSPIELARDMSEDIDMGINRAKTIARTEIMRAHNVASINTYRDAGILNVEVQAEWSTAGDERVCPQCSSLEGKIFTLDQIEPMLPLHPNCRCVALPLITNSENDKKEEA